MQKGLCVFGLLSVFEKSILRFERQLRMLVSRHKNEREQIWTHTTNCWEEVIEVEKVSNFLILAI